MLKTQHNAWVHFAATLVVLVFGLLFNLTQIEWCFIVLAIVNVWMAEALNTAVEFLADVTNPDFHPLVKKAKDVAAGAVLISAIGAILVGMIIFGPKLLS